MASKYMFKWGHFWFTLLYKEGYLWRFGGTYCLRLQIDWICPRRMLRKLAEKLVVCTGRIYTSEWPKFQQFPIQSTYSFHLLQHSHKPDWVSLKTQSAYSTVTSAKALAAQFETVCPINSQHLNSFSCGNLKTFCINELFTPLALCLIAGDRWHWLCEVEWQRNKVSLPYIKRECASTVVTARSALI